MPTNETSYDHVPYPGGSLPQAHPDRLAVIGRLFGLRTPNVSACRVLELGCGNGAHLVPLAWALPASEFVGVDLAGRPIAAGHRMARELGLKNIQLRQADVLAIGSDWGRFDYVVAHGLFSWVPAPVRAKVLTVCHDCLTPNGVAYVSYNAMPGGHLRNLLREMMRFHVHGFDTPQERVTQAKALVRFLADGQDTPDEYRLWLKAELQRVLEHDDQHLYHDDLADVNDSYYFTQFMEQASRHGLQYLGEADYFEMSDHIFKPTIRETLAGLGGNRMVREQYLDFLKCRRFRQTLLCADTVPLSAEPQRDAIAEFLVSSSVECQSGAAEVKPGVPCVFATPKGARVETDFALGKAALVELGAQWPRPLSFVELHDRARQRNAPIGEPNPSQAESRGALIDFLLSLYGAGAVEFRTHRPPLTLVPGERPVASPVARWQIQHGDAVTTLLHQSVRVEDEIGRCLLTQLDGTRDRPALAEEVRRLIESKDAYVEKDAPPEERHRKILDDLERNLSKLARLGLLVG